MQKIHMKNKKPILVTGSHRSGSTWIGRMIAKEPTIGYIHEPFNPDYYPHQLGRYTARFKHWFTYISSENEDMCLGELENTLGFRYQLTEALQELPVNESHHEAIEPLRILREYLICSKNRFLEARPLIKDPIALFSAEWMADKFDMKVIISIRHPAAFIGSLKVADWHYPFNHFLEQKLLIEDFLLPFKAEIQDIVNRESDIDEIDKAALLWKIMHYRILKYRECHPDWLFVRHEDISRDPLKEFKTIFNYLDLNYSESLSKTIRQYTSEQHSSQNVITYSNKASRAMNSKANIKSWQKKLSKSEIARIRDQVEDVAKNFYADSDWE
jgi:hypothetical protein